MPAQVITYTAPQIAHAAPVETQYAITEASLGGKIDYYSELYKVDSNLIRKIIKCESGNKPNAVGDHGNSFGLSQIYLPAHPTITKEMALDTDFAIDFLAKNLSQGKGKLWTCYAKVKAPRGD